MKMNITLVLMLSFLLFACSGKQNQLNEINKLEESLYGNSTTEFNKDKALQLVNMYFEFAEANQEDTNSRVFLFKAGEVAMGMMESNKAIECFHLLYTKYPEHKKASTSLFLEGFVYETQMKDLAMAQKIYLEFLQKYPDHSLANDAKFSLQNLGKSDEEIIKEFEQKIQEEANQNTTNPI